MRVSAHRLFPRGLHGGVGARAARGRQHATREARTPPSRSPPARPASSGAPASLAVRRASAAEGGAGRDGLLDRPAAAELRELLFSATLLPALSGSSLRRRTAADVFRCAAEADPRVRTLRV